MQLKKRLATFLFKKTSIFLRFLPAGLLPGFMKAFKSNPHVRFLQADMIKLGQQNLSKTMSAFDYQHPILVYPDGRSYSFMNGVLLSNEFTNRYLKVRGTHGENEAVEIEKFLVQHGVTPKTIVDAGCNVGEISLYFSLRFPQAKIVSIDAVPRNITRLKHNMSMQAFRPTNIIVEEVAIADFNGEIDMFTELNAESSIITDDRNAQAQKGLKKEKVRCETLSQILGRHGISQVDFLKLDIEGAEPLLVADILKIQPKAIFMEICNKNSKDAYTKMLGQLLTSGYALYAQSNQDFIREDNHQKLLDATWKQDEYIGYSVKSANVWLMSN